jgi:thioredoxin reductase (NADPH)
MDYDLAILGSGAGGCTAAIYAARRGLRVALFDGGVFGGIINTTPLVENWLGTSKISGPDLAISFRSHVESYPNVAVVRASVTAVRKEGGSFVLVTDEGESRAQGVVFATGAAPRKYGVPGEAEFSGKGVSYCAICDAPLYKRKAVAVVGGGDGALTAALLLSDVAEKVYLVHRRKDFRAEAALVDRAKAKANIETVLGCCVDRVSGSRFVETLSVHDDDGTPRDLKVAGVFFYIGHEPASQLARSLGCQVTEHGLIVTDARMRASVEGVWAAGDVRAGTFAQLVTAASDGCIAALDAAERLTHQRIKPESGA